MVIIVKETMLTYIHEEQQMCKGIMGKYIENLGEFTKLIGEKRPTSWLVLATGSSANAMLSAKYYMEKAANITIEIQEPFNFVHYEKIKPSTDLVLAVSQSGHSYSTIEALKKVHTDSEIPTIALTSRLDSPITEYADSVIDIGCGIEKVGFVTKGFTATVLTSMLMGLLAGQSLGSVKPEEVLQEIESIDKLVEQIANVIVKTEQFYLKNASELNSISRFDVIGYGPTVGTAKEAETKFTETVRVPTQGFELEAYMHGPYLEVDQDYGLLFIHNEGKLLERSQKLKQYFQGYTEHCFSIYSQKVESEDKKTLSLGVEIGEWMSPLLLAIPFQILSFRIANGRGIDLNIRIFDDFDKVLKSKI